MGERLNEWRCGWRTMAGALLSAGAGISIFGAVNGFFVKPLAAEFGWSRGQATLSSGAILLTALLMPALAVVVDRVGPRRVMLIGGALFGVAYLALAAMSGEIWIYAAIMLLIGLTAGPATALLVVTRPLVSEFTRSRGLAISVGMSGAVFVCLPLLPWLQHLIATYGWRSGYLFMAPLSLAMGVAAFLLLPGRAAKAGMEAAEDAEGHTFREAIAQPRFWLLLLSTVAVSLVGGAFSTQLQPLLSDRGVPGVTAALFGSLYAGSVVAGRVVAGLMLDRLWSPAAGAICLVTASIGAVFFMAAGPDLTLLAVGVVLVGAAAGAEADMMAFFAARYFGLRAFNAVLGVLGMAFGLGIAFGGIGAGVLFDLEGSYDTMIRLAVGLGVVSAGALLLSGVVGRRQASAA
ncbi:MAG: MFS transporter [Phenylobacterium sp.]|nr:MFS transporter [Phenylobacterium sp.]